MEGFHGQSLDLPDGTRSDRGKQREYALRRFSVRIGMAVRDLPRLGELVQALEDDQTHHDRRHGYRQSDHFSAPLFRYAGCKGQPVQFRATHGLSARRIS